MSARALPHRRVGHHLGRVLSLCPLSAFRATPHRERRSKVTTWRKALGDVLPGMNATWEAFEIGEVVVVVVAIDMVDVPTVWNAAAGIKPNLPMEASLAMTERSPARIVVEPTFVAAIDDTAVFNHLDHMILSCGIIWHFRSAKATRPCWRTYIL
jgi:hypothetical protein